MHIAPWSHSKCHSATAVRSGLTDSKKQSQNFGKTKLKNNKHVWNTCDSPVIVFLSGSENKNQKKAHSPNTRKQTAEIHESEENKCLTYGRSHSHIVQRGSLIRVKDERKAEMVVDWPHCIHANNKK